MEALERLRMEARDAVCGVGCGGKRRGCQEWDSNPRLQGRLRPERSALDRSAILTTLHPYKQFRWKGQLERAHLSFADWI